MEILRAYLEDCRSRAKNGTLKVDMKKLHQLENELYKIPKRKSSFQAIEKTKDKIMFGGMVYKSLTPTEVKEKKIRAIIEKQYNYKPTSLTSKMVTKDSLIQNEIERIKPLKERIENELNKDKLLEYANNNTNELASDIMASDDIKTHENYIRKKVSDKVVLESKDNEDIEYFDMQVYGPGDNIDDAVESIEIIPSIDGEKPINIKATKKAAEMVHALRSKSNNFPQFLSHIKKVKDLHYNVNAIMSPTKKVEADERETNKKTVEDKQENLYEMLMSEAVNIGIKQADLEANIEDIGNTVNFNSNNVKFENGLFDYICLLFLKCLNKNKQVDGFITVAENNLKSGILIEPHLKVLKDSKIDLNIMKKTMKLMYNEHMFTNGDNLLNGFIRWIKVNYKESFSTSNIKNDSIGTVVGMIINKYYAKSIFSPAMEQFYNKCLEKYKWGESLEVMCRQLNEYADDISMRNILTYRVVKYVYEKVFIKPSKERRQIESLLKSYSYIK